METIADVLISPLTTAIEADMSHDEAKPDQQVGQAVESEKAAPQPSLKRRTRQGKGSRSKRVKKPYS